MSRIRDWSIGRRLGLAFGLLLLGLAAFVGTLQYWLAENEGILTDFTGRTMRQVQLAHALERSVLETSIAFRTYLIKPGPEVRRAYEEHVGRTQALVSTFDVGVRDPEVRAVLERVHPTLDEYARQTAAAIAGDNVDAERATAALRDNILADVGALSMAQERAGERALANVQANRRAIVRGIWIIAALMTLSLVVIGWATTSSVREPARELAQVADAMQRGEWRAALALRSEAPGGGNEMRHLEAALGAAARALEQRERELRESHEEIQAQNEELQAQNEEIHAQAEEIRAQGEELAEQNEELRAQAATLQRQSRELEALDARKNEFLGVLAHELRNPLAPITNGLQLLQQVDPASPAWARTREIMARQVRHLSRLVDDLLDVTRISHGKITLRRERVDLVQAVREAMNDQQAAADAAGVSLEQQLPREPAWVDADATRIHQVFGNLLGNALKFTPAGGRVSVALRTHEGVADVAIRDTGIGMDAALVARLFKPFSQGAARHGSQQGGLGLGLALAKALVTLHGGTITASSPGREAGAEFLVRLPLAVEGRAGGEIDEQLLRLAGEIIQGMAAVEDDRATEGDRPA